MKKITLLLIFIGSQTFAQIINTAPYILTIDEAKQWTTTGTTASSDLISTVPLATRFVNTATQFNPALSNDMKIAYLPDGMNNFGNYSGEQSQFNFYNFTHWQYIDKLVWFGGTASQTIQLPSAPWANAAHKNGVRIFGNVFFAPTVFGGSTATLTNFLEQDGGGNFVIIPKMIEMMQYYNFDGWFINQETATNSATAALMYSFVKALTAQTEALGKEVMWYDAMILSGSVGWQNRLNNNNSVFVQRDENADGTFESRVSSNIFINFFWSQFNFPAGSRTRATAIGRSQFDVFTGVDIWPDRNQGNIELNGNNFMTNLHENTIVPYTSLGIFAPNCVYNSSTFSDFNTDPNDYADFYNAENRMFAGIDNNPATVDASGFKGLANWIPEASVISTLPFSTDFCTGHGLKKFDLGVQTSADSWHDMNKQAILPTWQFAFSENNALTAEWDFTAAVSNGNSLKISGNLPANHAIDLMLFKTKLETSSSPDPAVFIPIIDYKSQAADPNMKLILVFANEPNQKYEFPIVPGGTALNNGWVRHQVDVGGGNPQFYSRDLAMIGLRFESDTAIPDYKINIGNLNVSAVGLLGTTREIKNTEFVTVSYPLGNNAVVFTINWQKTKNINYAVSDLQGKTVKLGSIKLDGTTTYTFDTTGMASGTYLVKFSNEKNVSETKKIIVK